jgi:hypothetical protein
MLATEVPVNTLLLEGAHDDPHWVTLCIAEPQHPFSTAENQCDTKCSSGENFWILSQPEHSTKPESRICFPILDPKLPPPRVPITTSQNRPRRTMPIITAEPSQSLITVVSRIYPTASSTISFNIIICFNWHQLPAENLQQKVANQTNPKHTRYLVVRLQTRQREEWEKKLRRVRLITMMTTRDTVRFLAGWGSSSMDKWSETP